jgi:hypothetical protein
MIAVENSVYVVCDLVIVKILTCADFIAVYEDIVSPVEGPVSRNLFDPRSIEAGQE